MPLESVDKCMGIPLESGLWGSRWSRAGTSMRRAGMLTVEGFSAGRCAYGHADRWRKTSEPLSIAGRTIFGFHFSKKVVFVDLVLIQESKGRIRWHGDSRPMYDRSGCCSVILLSDEGWRLAARP